MQYASKFLQFQLIYKHKAAVTVQNLHLVQRKVSKLRLPPTAACLISCEQLEDTHHEPGSAHHTHPCQTHPRTCDLSNRLSEKRPRQTLIGTEWDYLVCQRSNFANVIEQGFGGTGGPRGISGSYCCFVIRAEWGTGGSST